MNSVTSRISAFWRNEKIKKSWLDNAHGWHWQAVAYYPEVDTYDIERGKKAAHDFFLIGLDCCFFCKKEIVPYNREYIADNGDNGKLIYSMVTGVCENCAAEQVAKSRLVRYPDIVSTYERKEKGKTIIVHEYSDGCITEGIAGNLEITSKEENI